MANAELKGLNIKRGYVKGRMTNIETFLNAIDFANVTPENKYDALVREKKIEEIYNSYDLIQSEIDASYDDELPLEEVDERDAFETRYYSVAARLHALLRPIAAQPQIAANSNSQLPVGVNGIAPAAQQIKLPEIKLPKFSGTYDDWLEFRDTFRSLIHCNCNISDMQKFHYLRAALSGDAALTLGSTEFSADNYEAAWLILCDRYNSTRLLVHHHIKALFSFEKQTRESASSIRFILDNLAKHLCALNMLKEPTKHWDALLIYLITSKLDAKTAREWEESCQRDTIPTLDELKMFLRDKADLLETIDIKRNDKESTNSTLKSHSIRNNNPNNNNKHVRTFTVANQHCILCKGKHNITNCSEFLALTIDDRFERLRMLKSCINCLRPGHFANVCRASYCRKCHRRHHILMHRERESTDTTQTQPGASSSSTNEIEQAIVMNATCRADSVEVFMPTALVKVRDSSGIQYDARVILDSCSQSSFITSDLAKRLHLPLTRFTTCIQGVQQISAKSFMKTQVEIHSRINNFTLHQPVLVLPTITPILPSQQIDTKILRIPPHLRLADPSYNIPAPIDILIGADSYCEVLSVGMHRLGPNLPNLLKTQFGWVIMGAINSIPLPETVCNVTTARSIDTRIERFWELEECTLESKANWENCDAEMHFKRTTSRDENGRYIVDIPMKNVDKLGDSYSLALKRFYAIERKLNRNACLKKGYSSFIHVYLHLGHMREVNDNDLAAKPHYYLPHHAVHNEMSTTTKLRVVFDASAKTSTGYSLNDCQIIGPTIQDELFCILLRFRQHAYAVTADITKMYRQILITPEQRKLHRILWRDNHDETIRTYELQTVTYGTAAASFLSTRVLKAVSDSIAAINPNIALRIRRDFYMDDLNTGYERLEEAIDSCGQISDALRAAGFDLCKWTSNEPRIIAQFSDANLSNTMHSFDAEAHAKTLGLLWQPQNDCLTYGIGEFVFRRAVTKRHVLSTISQVFDPLGLVGPCIILGKLFMQKLWQLNVSWDESLSQFMHSEWTEFHKSLSYLNSCRIPRYCVNSNVSKIYLHGFCDSSERAYGACAYAVYLTESGTVGSHLLCAKNKVAPLKSISIPRLELCGALLLSKLINKILSTMSIVFEDCYLWSDSTVVLAWLRHCPSQLKTFIANRVSKIQTLTETCHWRYVPSAENPADHLSRGVQPQDLISDHLWWQGPQFLKRDISFWPPAPNASPVLEELKTTQAFVAIREVRTRMAAINFDKFSSLTRLERVIAYVLRFIKRCRDKSAKHTSFLTLREIKDAHLYIIQSTQASTFGTTIHDVSEGKITKLDKLSPFVDARGLLRVGGRLENSTLPYDTKHPIILSADSHVTKLIFERIHLTEMHIGPLGLLNTVRQRYWPLRGRNLARRTVHNCIICFKNKPTRRFPQMGQLPAPRVTPAYPFLNCGVDYAGPFELRASHLRGNRTYKGYVALFVCMSTRAIHLELVTGLDTEHFIAALRRFAARRGVPSNIYSDNGTNFVGALNELKRYLKANHDQICAAAQSINISWHFIPPWSPHFGGLWEAGVKSVKFHLKRVIGKQTFTYEKFATLSTQIEAIVNSRPLSPLSSDPNDLCPLTPGHFLVGRPLTSVVEPPLAEERINRATNFRLIQHMTAQFWRRWQRDFMNQLQQLAKWAKKGPELVREGDLVLLVEENTPTLNWRLGRVEELHTGRDGITRVVTVKTRNGRHRRTLTKLCPLPSNQPADYSPPNCGL